MHRRVLVVTGDQPTELNGHRLAGSHSPQEPLAAALGALPDYEFEVLSQHHPLLERLLEDPPDLVLDLCNGGLDSPIVTDPHLSALLELLDIPFTGPGPAGVVLCDDKHVVERVAHGLGVPVPRSLFLAPGADYPELEAFYPALIKPARGDLNAGIFPQSVVHTPEEAREHLAWLRRNRPGVAALWQEYLRGPEYLLTLIGNPDATFEALPPLEVDFSRLPDDLPEILACESAARRATPYSRIRFRPAQLSAAVFAELQAEAELLFRRLECRDYARFDFRTSEDGVIKLLDVNPNPAWGAAAKIAITAQYAGMSYAQLLGRILDAAWTRITSSRPAI